MALTARNARTGQPLALRVKRCEALRDRVVGLLGRKDLAEGDALWLSPCSQVHTFFMAFPIDVLFLDRDGRALKLSPNLVPWRISPWVWRASGALEMKAGSLAGKVEPGDRVEFRDE
jgi:uncharacterized protein